MSRGPKIVLWAVLGLFAVATLTGVGLVIATSSISVKVDLPPAEAPR